MKMKKIISLLTCSILAFTLAACGGEQPAPAKNNEQETQQMTPKDLNEDIHVVSREDGSGTRSAFTEITGILVEENNEKVDKTVKTAQISPSTNEVMTFVAGDLAGIGYISLGSLNDTVKALKIEGAKATPEEIISGNYKIARPYNICYKEASLDDVSKDFIRYIMSEDGQNIIENGGYIKVSDESAYEKSGDFEGKITIQGSTSIAPIMEKLIESYSEQQPNVVIEITANGSSAGVKAAIADQATIGMASRELKEEELSEVDGLIIAQDGIAVVVNNDNPVEELSIEQVRQIFTGKITNWSEVQ